MIYYITQPVTFCHLFFRNFQIIGNEDVMTMPDVQYLFPLVLCSLCMPERFADATPALTEELACTPGTRCNCMGSNMTVMFCSVSDGLFTLPIDVPPQIRSVKIVGQNFSINFSNRDYGDSWQSIKALEIFGNDDEGDLRLPKTFTDKLRRTKLFRIRNVGLTSIDLYAFADMILLEHLDLSNNIFLSFYDVLDGLSWFRSNLETLNISGINSGKRMAMFSSSLYAGRDLESALRSVRHLDISWTRAFSALALPRSAMNLTTLNISGTHLYQGFDCPWNLLQFDYLQDMRIDYWPTMAKASRWTRATRATFKGMFPLPSQYSECSNLTTGCYLLPHGLKCLSLMNSEAAEFYIDFQENVCIDSTLEYLNLRNLRITKPIGTVTGLHYLKKIDVSGTGMAFSLRLFHDMTSLKEILASGNRLSEVENGEEFHKLFIYNYAIQKVDLSRNGMKVIPYDLFSHNGQLEMIDLSNNKLEYLKLDLRFCRTLRKLSLSGNRFKVNEGVVDINLDFVVTIHNSLAISEIVKETGISCTCANDTRSLVIPDPQAMYDYNCVDASDTKNNSENDTDPYSIKCSSRKLGVIAPMNESTGTADLPSAKPLIVGISIPVCAFVMIAMTVVLIWRKRQIRKIMNTGEQIVLKEIDRENDEDVETVLPVQDQIVPQEIDNEVIVVAGEERQRPDQIVVNAEAVRPDPDQNVQEVDPETNDESTQTVPDQIYYIGLNEDSYSTNDRKPCFAAFLAYSHMDRDVVIDKIYYPLQRMLHELLPNWDEEYLTVLYDKHFLPGQCTMEVCRAAVFNSHVTVPIISDAFSRSTWCHHEIELAIEARAPIVPVYIPGFHTDRFPAVVKYVYEHKVRVIWPDTNNSETLSEEELSVVRDIAFSIATYVKHTQDKERL